MLPNGGGRFTSQITVWTSEKLTYWERNETKQFGKFGTEILKNGNLVQNVG